METAGAIKAVKRFGDIAAGVAEKISRLSRPVLRVLTFSLASDAVARASAFCAQIDKGRIDVIYAVRSFSKYSHCPLPPKSPRPWRWPSRI